MNANETIESYVGDVIRRLPRRQRSDVGFELRELLQEELQAKAESAGRPADGAMATELLHGFGQPQDVAARYHPPGFNLIEPAAAPSFVYIAVTGVALQWLVSFVHVFTAPGNTDALSRLGGWWTSAGLGAFWWPGFMLMCFAVGAWVRKRWPAVGRWKPTVADRERVNRPLLVLGLVAAAAGVALLIALPWTAAHTLPAAAARALAYDPEFIAQRAVWVLPLWAAQFVLLGIALFEGRWNVLTRKLQIALTAAICGLLAWWLASGNIFASRPTDGIAKLIMALILFFGLIDVAVKLYRQDAVKIVAPIAPPPTAT